jgi:hypothetical protein
MGLAKHNEYYFIASQYDYKCHYLDFWSSDSLEIYLDFTQTFDDIYDITWDDGDIWIAHDSSTEPVRRFNVSGAIIDFLPGSLIPQATGLTMDDEGYLWVSDNDNDLIYRVDLETALDRNTWGWIKAILQ